MKYDTIDYLIERLEYLQNPINLSSQLYDMSEFYDNTPSEQAFYSNKQDYLLMVAQNWQEETEQVINKLDHLSRLAK
jgi:chemotaxis regulatin CheY-phosphate phosphatase CheZ